MPNAIIRCRQCGRTYNVDPKDLDRADIVYSCECGKEIEVDFFDHCPNCGVNIGFASSGSVKEILTTIGMNTVKSFINPINAIGTIIETASMMTAKESNVDAVCPRCGTRYIRCRNCYELTEIPSKINMYDTFRCKSCGTELTPCGVKNDSDARNHSEAFYNDDNVDEEEYLDTPSNEFITGTFSDDFHTCVVEKMDDAIENLDSIEELINYYAGTYYQDDPCQQTNYYFLLSILLTQKLNDDNFYNFDSDDLEINYALIKKAKTYVRKAYDASEHDKEIKLFLQMYGIWDVRKDQTALFNYIQSFPKLKENENNFFLTASYISKLWHAHVAAAIERHKEEFDSKSKEYSEILKFWVDKYKNISESYDSDDSFHFSWMSMADDLAVRYLDGIYGVSQDYSKALELLKITVNIGSRFQGMCNLGEMYELGKGVKQDRTIAMKYYKDVIENTSEDNYNHKYAKERLDGMSSYSNMTSLDSLDSSEKEYLEEYRFMLEDGDIGDRERRSLERLRSRLGISNTRATQLEALINNVSLSDKEQEYLDEYKEIRAEGEIRDRDRRSLDRLAQRNGISAQRMQELEKMV